VLADDVALSDLAGWVACAALSGLQGDAISDAIRTKVQGTLGSWCRRHGQAKLDELKQTVTEQMQNQRADGKLTEEELRQRIDAFFNEIPT
jgi:hypothetical protein